VISAQVANGISARRAPESGASGSGRLRGIRGIGMRLNGAAG
jgi:hypothetical protein